MNAFVRDVVAVLLVGTVGVLPYGLLVLVMALLVKAMGL